MGIRLLDTKRHGTSSCGFAPYTLVYVHCNIAPPQTQVGSISLKPAVVLSGKLLTIHPLLTEWVLVDGRCRKGTNPDFFSPVDSPASFLSGR